MANLELLQVRLRALGYAAILVPSTDEFLCEFAQARDRRLAWVTGFEGSMGLAMVHLQHSAMFLDGRYKSQGQRDTAGSGIEVLEADEATRRRWLAAHLRGGDRLAIDTRLHSYPDVERILQFAKIHDIEVVAVDRNPIDELWGAGRPAARASVIHDYSAQFAGEAAETKCAQLREWLTANGADCLLLADPEDVAWLLNVRTHDSLAESTATGWPIVPIPLSRALVEVTGATLWFVDGERLEPALRQRLGDAITIVDPDRMECVLQERMTGKSVAADLGRTPHRLAAIAARVGALRSEQVVARRRWIKHPNEVERAREGHYRDGQAVIRFLAWLRRTVPNRIVTELDASRKLTELRCEITGYMGPSMPLMSASGASGAMAHYVPSEETNRRLNDHPLYWMDSGAQYYGCSTDNTVCIAVGQPESRHIRAHTLVVKGFIALAVARFPAGIHSTQLDSFARQYLWQEGMDYRHGTGHGVGNFMNIHEGPAIRKEIDFPTVARMEAGMIVSNEPAYYADNDFGVRIESHLVTVPSRHVGFLEFETLSRLPIDPRLIDESLMNATERLWLATYHVGIVDGYRGCFDKETASWLQVIADAYVAMAPSVMQRAS